MELGNKIEDLKENKLKFLIELVTILVAIIFLIYLLLININFIVKIIGIVIFGFFIFRSIKWIIKKIQGGFTTIQLYENGCILLESGEERIIVFNKIMRINYIPEVVFSLKLPIRILGVKFRYNHHMDYANFIMKDYSEITTDFFIDNKFKKVLDKLGAKRD